MTSGDGIGRRDPREGTVGLARASLEKLDDEGVLEVDLRLAGTVLTLRGPQRSAAAEEILGEVLHSFGVTLKALDMASEALFELRDTGTAAQCVAVSKRGHSTLQRFREAEAK